MVESVIPSQSGAPADDADAYSQRVGSIVNGKWSIESLLGVGGMAAVYAAAHRNGQRAALKILHIDFAKDKVVCDRFLREAYVSNKIGHHACVKVLDDDKTEMDEPFLVMELLDGETLRELWMHTGRRMPVARVLEIMDTILDCLDACHALGVIHRDLKPANIFICKDGSVKVLDFGVAQFRSATVERTATGTALGTPAYMSPEQAMGLVDQLDGRADLFSVGAMVHALVSGHRINKGRTENEALVMAATTPVPSIARVAPDLPVCVIALIDKALAWDRRNRFESAKAMRQAAAEALAEVSGAPLVEVSKVRATRPRPDGTSPAAPQHGQRLAATSASPALKARDNVVAPSPAETEVEPVAAIDDPRVTALRDLWKRIDRVLPSVRQFGWEHPSTERVLRTAFEGFVDAMRQNPAVVEFSVRPYSLMRFGQTVWEPISPFDAIPYNLFACGIRAMRVKPGVTLEEMRDLLTMMLLEPGRDLSPEDDIATALWEKALPHVEYDVVDALAEGDAAEREAFYNESDEVERLAESAARAKSNRLEAKAMAISTDRDALHAGRVPSPMALDDVVRAVYASQLVQPRERWSDRYVDVLAHGLVDAAMNRDAQLVLASLRKSAADLVVAGRVDVVTQLHESLVERFRERLPSAQATQLSAGLTNALFGAETFELMLKRLQAEPHRLGAFEPVLAALSPDELPTVLAAMRAPLPPPLLEVLLRYVERVLPGHESDVAGAAAGLDAGVGSALVALLSKANTHAARQAISMLAQSDNLAVRIEARIVATGGNPEGIGAELAALCEDQRLDVRLAALRAIAAHAIKGAWPALARRAKSTAWSEIDGDERDALLAALLVASLDRGEPIALEIAKKAGVFASEGREAARLSAIEALGQHSRSALVVSGLREIAQARWGTSDETRAAAANAADHIAQRIAHSGAQPSSLSSASSDPRSPGSAP